MAAPLDYIPVFQRGGSIVPRQQRVRRSSALMLHDPYTLVVALDARGSSADGTLYMDDGRSHAHRAANGGLFRRRRFAYRDGALTGSADGAPTAADAGAHDKDAPANTVERLVVLGLKRRPSAVVVASEAAGGGGAAGRELGFQYDAATSRLVVRKPDVRVAFDFKIELRF